MKGKRVKLQLHEIGTFGTVEEAGPVVGLMWDPLKETLTVCGRAGHEPMMRGVLRHWLAGRKCMVSGLRVRCLANGRMKLRARIRVDEWDEGYAALCGSGLYTIEHIHRLGRMLW